MIQIGDCHYCGDKDVEVDDKQMCEECWKETVAIRD